MSDNGLARPELISIIVKTTLLGLVSYYALKWTIDAVDPTRKKKKEAQEKAMRLLHRIGINDSKLELNEYELSIAAQLIDPSTIDTCWDDIAGLDEIIDDIKMSVIVPLKNPELFAISELHQSPKGMLLHGPPGCGKTMIAKATAKAAGARFINLQVECLTDKWYGESQKLAAAVFTLALKLQPCIIFIDEIDTFLRARSTDDHEATAMIKAQFMIYWDGLISAKNCQVVVIGATNKPSDVDKAILRRMPAMVHVRLPNQEKRLDILRLIMEKQQFDSDVSFEHIASTTEGFSGSDLRELCRTAAMIRVKEASQITIRSKMLSFNTLRPISAEDFVTATRKMKEAKVFVDPRFQRFKDEGLD